MSAVLGPDRYRERRNHPGASGHDIHGISWKLTPVRGAATRGGARWPARPVRPIPFPSEVD